MQRPLEVVTDCGWCILCFQWICLQSVPRSGVHGSGGHAPCSAPYVSLCGRTHRVQSADSTKSRPLCPGCGDPGVGVSGGSTVRSQLLIRQPVLPEHRHRGPGTGPPRGLQASHTVLYTGQYYAVYLLALF